jgi:hypothetical protein
MSRPRPEPQMAAPGWYPHPAGGMAYFDGRQWVQQSVTPKRVVTHVAIGWVLLAAGAVVTIGSFLPWATALGGLISKAGTDGGSDGWFTVVLGLAIAAVGLTIGLGQGLLWAPIVGAVLALLAAGVCVADINDVSSRGPGVAVGSGLLLCAVGAAAGLITALAGLAVRG